MRHYLLWVFFILYGSLAELHDCHAEKTSPSPFEQGFQAYLEKNYINAAVGFHEALKKNPRSSAASMNLALTYVGQEDYGRAVAYFRYSLHLDPWLSSARHGLAMAQDKLPIKGIPHEPQILELLHQKVLTRMSFVQLLSFLSLLILTSGWIFLQELGQRRRAQKASEPPSPFSIKLIFLTVLTVSLCLFLGLKSVTSQNARGTLLEGPVEVLSAPEEGASIATFYAGFEVIIRRSYDGWLQINYPGGPTGWVKKDSVLIYPQ